MRQPALLFLLFVSHFSFAQFNKQSYPYAFQKSDLVVNLGLSVAHRRTELPSNSFRHGIFPAITLAADYGLTDFLGLGPYGSFFARSFRYETPSDNFIYHANLYIVGIQASLHLSPWLEKTISQDLDSEHMDIYLRFIGGYQNIIYLREQFESDPEFGWGAFAGMRYFFSEHFGLFAEAGYGPFEFVMTGVSFRL